MVGRGGFEPPKTKSTDLQSVAFGRSAIFPCLHLFFNEVLCLISGSRKSSNYSGSSRVTLGASSPEAENLAIVLVPLESLLVPRTGIEPVTQGFSVLCSTD